MALADPSGRVLALQTTRSSLTTQCVEALLHTTLAKNRSSDWWFNDGRIFIRCNSSRVGTPVRQNELNPATVVVVQEFDARGVRDLGRLLPSEVALHYEGRTLESTFDP